MRDALVYRLFLSSSEIPRKYAFTVFRLRLNIRIVVYSLLPVINLYACSFLRLAGTWIMARHIHCHKIHRLCMILIVLIITCGPRKYCIARFVSLPASITDNVGIPSQFFRVLGNNKTQRFQVNQ